MPRHPLEDKPGQKPYGQRSSERRRQQNREAQRLLRERRAQHDAEIAQRLRTQEEEIESLHLLVEQLRAENARLRGEPSAPTTMKSTPGSASSSTSFPPSTFSNGGSGSPSGEEVVMRGNSFPDLGPGSGSISPTTAHPMALHQSTGPLNGQGPSISSMPPTLPPLPSIGTMHPSRMSTSYDSGFFGHSGIPLTSTAAMRSLPGASLDIEGMNSPNRMMFLADAVAQSLRNQHHRPSTSSTGPSEPTLVQGSEDSSPSMRSNSPLPAEAVPRPSFHIPSRTIDDHASTAPMLNGNRIRGALSFTVPPDPNEHHRFGASTPDNEGDSSGGSNDPLSVAGASAARSAMQLSELGRTEDLPMGTGMWAGGSFPWPPGRSSALGGRSVMS